MSNIQLLNCDCMEYMAICKDKQFDLAIVDPPYGIDYATRGNGNGMQTKHRWINHPHKDWDDSIPSAAYFIELARISKNRIVWGGNYMTDHLPPSRCWVIWDKIQEFSLADFEQAWTSFDKPARAFRFSRGEATNEKKYQAIHPTQKPVSLYKWLLHNYAKEGDKIFDSHGGSMSIAIACHDMNFDLTLCEIDKDYFDAGKKRYENHIKQIKLFQ